MPPLADVPRTTSASALVLMLTTTLGVHMLSIRALPLLNVRMSGQFRTSDIGRRWLPNRMPWRPCYRDSRKW